MTLKLPLAVLPAASVAEQLTGVVPSGKVLSETGAQLGAIGLVTLSLAEAVYVTTAPDALVAWAVWLARFSVGGVVSTMTLRMLDAAERFPAVSLVLAV